VDESKIYFFSVFGTPSAKDRWGWRVEGHHLALNFNGTDCLTPKGFTLARLRLAEGAIARRLGGRHQQGIRSEVPPVLAEHRRALGLRGALDLEASEEKVDHLAGQLLGRHRPVRPEPLVDPEHLPQERERGHLGVDVPDLPPPQGVGQIEPQHRDGFVEAVAHTGANVAEPGDRESRSSIGSRPRATPIARLLVESVSTRRRSTTTTASSSRASA